MTIASLGGHTGAAFAAPPSDNNPTLCQFPALLGSFPLYGVATGLCLSDVVNVSGNAAITSGNCGNEVCWVGGNGTFNKSIVSCSGIWSDTTELTPGCTVGGFAGSFSNTVCGSGTAIGTASNIREAGTPAGNAGGTANFNIQFIAGVGILSDTGGSTEAYDDPIPVPPVAPYPAFYNGIVFLSPNVPAEPFAPNPLAPFFGSCVTNFNFNSIDWVLETPPQP